MLQSRRLLAGWVRIRNSFSLLSPLAARKEVGQGGNRIHREIGNSFTEGATLGTWGTWAA